VCLRLDLCRGVRLELCDVLAHWPAHGAGVAAVRPAPAVASVDVQVVLLLRCAISIVLLNGCAAVRWLEISLHIPHRAPIIRDQSTAYLQMSSGPEYVQR
jgi:hypothetical protein